MSASSHVTLFSILHTFSAPEARAYAAALFNGQPSFDPSQCSAAQIVGYVEAWIAGGALDAPTAALHAATIIAARPQPVPAAPTPPAPLTIPVFAPRAAPTHAVLDEASTFAPAPSAQQVNAAMQRATAAQINAAAGAPSPAATQRAIQAAIDAQCAQPSPAVAPAVDDDASEPAPHVAPIATPVNAPTRVAARSLFADQPSTVLDAIPQGLSVTVYNSPDAPAVNPVYAFNAENLALALGALATSPATHTWLGGPRGTGKTEFARQIAARLGRAFFRVNFNRSTEAADILGDIGLTNGNTAWADGPVAAALRTPGAILLLDEPTYAAQGHIASLNPVLERDGATVRLPRTGERLPIAADIAVYLADNTFGHGDVSGEYIARSPMGSDTLDRVGLFLHFDYLPEPTERKVLRAMVHRMTGVKADIAMVRNVCALMKIARTKADAGELIGAPSLRRAAAFCAAMVQGTAPVVAFTACIVRAAPEDSQEALRQIYAATWPHTVGAPRVVNANPFAGDEPGTV